MSIENLKHNVALLNVQLAQEQELLKKNAQVPLVRMRNGKLPNNSVSRPRLRNAAASTRKLDLFKKPTYVRATHRRRHRHRHSRRRN